jgi:TM2 domain-containing membrane protein YozV
MGFIDFKQIFSKTLILKVCVLINEITVHRGIKFRMIKINFAFFDLEFHGSLIGA